MFGQGARIVVAGGLAIMVLTACGEDRLTRREFATRADRICARANERLADLETPQTPEGFADYARRAEDLTRAALEDLRSLVPPEAIEEDVDRMIERLREATERLPDLVEAARREDLAEAGRITQEIADLTDEAGELARTIGLEECVGTGVGSAP